MSSGASRTEACLETSTTLKMMTTRTLKRRVARWPQTVPEARDSRRTRIQCLFAVSDDRGFMFCRYMYPYFFGQLRGKLNKPACSGGFRGSRTDYLLLIGAFGSTRSCGQQGYLAATHHPPRWRNTRVHSNRDRNRLAHTVLGSDRTRLRSARMDSRYLDSCPTLVLSLDWKS
jgi:hypothetical protein